MKLRIKIVHVIVGICAILFFLRLSLIVETLKLLFYFFGLLFSDVSSSLNQVNFELADTFISLILIIVIPVIAIIYRGKWFLKNTIKFNSLVLIILAFFFIYAPFITGINPDFQKDLRVTKLLPPLSTVKVLYLKSNIKFSSEFFQMKEEVIKSSFDESIIFADSVVVNSNVTYYQKDKGITIEKEKLSGFNGIPKIETKYFLLGSDEYGRDVFARLVYGARISLFVGLGAVIITFFFGVVLGFIAGYAGGFTDTILSRFTDMLLAFPIIFLIILIIALFGNSLFTIIFVLGYSGWMSLFKIVRGEVISIKQKEYFISAKLAGLTGSSLLIKEIFPVILVPVVVNLVFQYGNVILAESALSYLGLGTGNLYPSWGGMIESGQEYLSEAWWMIFFPGLALIVTLLTANNLGKEINLFYNPRLKYD